MLVLVTEPAGTFRDRLARTLDAAGIDHVEADDLFGAADLARSLRAEVVALGPSLATCEAAAIARRLSEKAAVVAVPTTRNEAATARLEAAGAVATLVRPISPDAAEQVIRAAAIDRFAGRGVRRIAGVGGAVIDFETRSIHVRDSSAPLRPLEYRIAEILALRRGETLSRDEILDRLHPGGREAAHKIVGVPICTLRRTLRAHDCASPIETRRGGYAFGPAVDRIVSHEVA